MRSYGNQSFAIRDRNASHNIRGLSYDSTLVCSIVAMVSVATLISLSSWLRLNMLWRKLHVMNVFTIATAKILRTSTKRPTVGTKSTRSLIYQPGEAEAKFRNIRTAYGRYLKRLKTLPSGSGRDAVPREFKNLQWLNPHINKFACSKTSSSTSAMLFALQPTRACIFGTSADQNVWLRSALRSLRLYGNSFFAIVCDCLRSAICDLRLSAIVCDHMETSLKD